MRNCHLVQPPKRGHLHVSPCAAASLCVGPSMLPSSTSIPIMQPPTAPLSISLNPTSPRSTSGGVCGQCLARVHLRWRLRSMPRPGRTCTGAHAQSPPAQFLPRQTRAAHDTHLREASPSPPPFTTPLREVVIICPGKGGRVQERQLEYEKLPARVGVGVSGL